MVILVEGPRGSGKSHLVNSFIQSNSSSSIFNYKFEFPQWIERLGIQNLEDKEPIHYFSVSNILTVLDFANLFFKDKVIILDRSILSAYVWSQFRKRIEWDQLVFELSNILNNRVYSNCVLLHVSRENPKYTISRGEKDIFDDFEDYNKESEIYNKIFNQFKTDLENPKLGNQFKSFKNGFDRLSEVNFNRLLAEIIDK